MTFKENNILGNLINTTWGKYSSPSGTHSIKCDLAGQTMTFKYSTIVYFASEQSARDQFIRSAEEAIQRLDSYMGLIKSEFKEVAGTSLKTTETGGGDDIELIQSTSNSPRKIAYYRMNKTFQLG